MMNKNSVDSKAFLVQLICRIPYLLMIAVAGAVLGSGLYLLIMAVSTRTTMYENATKYYINFSEKKIDAVHYYNAYTWNDVIKTDLVLGRMMDTLGDGYDRERIASMMSSTMPSDPRYLNIYLRGSDPEEISVLGIALKAAMEAMGNEMEEFQKIYQIQDDGIKVIKVDYFTWRAAWLGALCFLLIALLIESIRFGIGSRFYTKTDVMRWLDLPVFGIRFKGGKFDSSQERQIELHLENIGYSMDNLNLVSVNDTLNNESYSMYKKSNGIVLLVPFGVDCREKTIDILQNLRLQNCNVVGVILCDVNKRWYKLYMEGVLSKL